MKFKNRKSIQVTDTLTRDLTHKLEADIIIAVNRFIDLAYTSKIEKHKAIGCILSVLATGMIELENEFAKNEQLPEFYIAHIRKARKGLQKK